MIVAVATLAKAPETAFVLRVTNAATHSNNRLTFART